MKHQLKQIDQFQKELTVELGKEELRVYIDQAEEALGRDIKLDGFRKGKVPKDEARKHIDPAAVLEAALDVAVRESLAKVIEAERFDVVNFSKFEVKENSSDKLIFKVILTLFPEVELKDFTGFKVTRREVAVDQKEVDETLNTIKSSRAKFTDKETPADKGDKVEIDFEVTVYGQTIDGGTSKNHPLILGKQNFIPGFEENIVGMKKDDKKSFSLNAPEDYYRKDMAGKKLDFEVKVNNVQSVDLPELDDEFAKSLVRFQSVGELTKNIKDGILEEKKLKEKQRIRLEVLNHIVSGSKISVPDFMVEKQLDAMIQDFDNNLHSNGMELGLYLAHVGKTQDDLRKDWKSEAEKQVKIFLILHKISRDMKITASAEEIDQQLNIVVQSMIMKGGMPKDNLNVNNLKEDIAAKIVNEKTLEFIENTCTA